MVVAVAVSVGAAVPLAAAARPGAGDMLSEDGQRRIEAAVKQAEQKTSAEIRCIIAKRVSTYPEVSLAFGVLGALVLAPAIVWLVGPASLLTLMRSWSASVAAPAFMTLILRYTLLQAVLFLILGVIATVPDVRVPLTPGFWKRRRVHHAAYAQYLATGLHQNPARTGVVIFACIEDRCVSVIADDIVHNAVGNLVWDEAVVAVQNGMGRSADADGLVQAIEICGTALARHFPGKSPNMLSDRPLEL
jgi:putative membrane protein